MNEFVQPIRLRLGHNIISSFSAVQGDTGREWHFIIDDYIVPTDSEFRIYIKKPSGKEIYNPGIYKDEMIVFQPTQQMLAEAGQSLGQLQIISSDKKMLSTFMFFINVDESLSAKIVSKDEFQILEQEIQTARELIAQMQSLIQTVTTQENQRVAAEKVRVAQENQRVEAEKLRQQNTASAIDKTNTATENAKSATTKATQAANNANEKANLADQAASNANTKANLANTAATNADQKANLANQAATNADNKAALVNTAVTNANEKANLANVAATNANNAATNANNKASLANTATSNANAAAKSANDAATKALEATKGLEGAVSGIINDNVASGTTTFSSNKINSLIKAQNIIAITNSQIDGLKSL